MKIKSDKYKEYKSKIAGSFPNDYMPDCVPADLYGHRVNLNKDDKGNLEKTAEDIQEFYDLEPSPNEGKNGGLAKDSDD